MTDRRITYDTIILIASNGYETFRNMSIDDVLGCNQGYYKEMYMIANNKKLKPEVIWDSSQKEDD